MCDVVTGKKERELATLLSFISGIARIFEMIYYFQL
jgi:hypothetical protein